MFAIVVKLKSVPEASCQPFLRRKNVATYRENREIRRNTSDAFQGENFMNLIGATGSKGLL